MAFQLFGVEKIFDFMAAAAFQQGMLSLQFEARERMVKRFHAAFEKDQIKISPLVFHVAELALGKFLLGMQPPAFQKLLFNGRVAGQTVLRHIFALGVMAFVAILQAFEKGM